MIHKSHIQKTLGKMRKLEEVYDGYIYSKTVEVSVRYMETKEHLYTVPADDSEWLTAEDGLVWGGPWSSIWFKGSFKVPASLHGCKLYVQARTDGVETFFWVNGKPKGIFTHPKEAANRGNHRAQLLTEEATAGDRYELAFEGYAGHPCVGTQPYQSYETSDGSPIRYERVFQSIDIVVCREEVEDFVYTLRTLNQIVGSNEVDDFRKGKIINALIDAFSCLSQSPEEEIEDEWLAGVATANRLLKPLLSTANSASGPQIGLIGHSHMDTAWLWTRDETIRKCARTYANALSLMEQYPEYTFIQSSAFHAELMRRHYPDIFEGIKRRVAEGRWEPNGGVWIESDCNLVSGESLVRQFLKGQRYTREYFGYQSDTFWLPDTFGYSAAIPQIMAGVGIRYFLTTKLSWNDTNLFPYDTFRWQGMDGTEVLTHFNTTHCWPDAETLIHRAYEKGNNGIQHRQVNDRRLVSYGFGDGGGGPTREMVEMSRRVQDTEGVPRSSHTTVSQFMQELEQSLVRPPLYVGELYFEGHRGTLTQMHRIKRNNRKAEFALRDLELAETIAWVYGFGQPTARTAELYETLLINQFHDILPGTSIPEVHDRAVCEVDELITEAKQMLHELLGAAMDGEKAGTVTLFNTLSWNRSGTIALPLAVTSGEQPADSSLVSQTIEDVFGQRKLLIDGVDVPAMGAATIALVKGDAAFITSPFRYDGNIVETPFAVVVFDEYGYITSFVDKASSRELRGDGYPLNALLLGEDLPGAWDNWDIDRDQASKLRLQTGLMSRAIVADGPLQLRVRSEYHIGKASTLKQDIVFHANTACVDFETVVDWQEKHRLLKVGFHVDVLSASARHEIQYGHVERPTHDNTPYDQGMFEVCNHKWTDLSENRFGVALLNDGKYGLSVNGADMRLTLHKGGTHPDPRGDAGLHETIYSLLPHAGGFSSETVIRPAYELNIAPIVIPGNAARTSFIQVDAPNVILETVKPAEEGNAYILRLYEAERSAVKGAKLRFGASPSRLALTNMLEDELEPLQLLDGELSLDFRAFEIKTIKVYM